MSDVDEPIPPAPPFSEADPLRWFVGLDLRERSHGAIHFARWLQEHGHGMHIDGAHMVDASLLELPDSGARVQLVDRAKRSAEAVLESLGVRKAFEHVQAVVTTDIVRALSVSGTLTHVTGLIIGRRAGGEERALIRLGRVARRLLRRADCPVFVVPPDLQAQHIGAGPIVCALSPDDSSLAAARMAVSLGERLERPVVWVHAIDPSIPMGLPYIPEATWDNLHGERIEVGRQAIADWHRGHGLPGEVSTITGPVVHELIAAARREDACMIVCGSRQLSGTDRLWSSSTGMGLAAGSHLPVAIIPGSVPRD